MCIWNSMLYALRRMVLVCCVLLSLVAGAQTIADTAGIHHLQTVRVIAPIPTREVLAPQRLQLKQLERLNSLSVADAVRFFAGVQVKDYGGIGGLKTVDVRSMGTNHLGVFYDGIQLGNAQNGQVDLGRFSLDNMAEIALYNGQKTTLLQTAKEFGAAGTLYLASLQPSFTDTIKTKLRATIKAGSFGLFNPSLLWQQKINKQLAITVNVEWIKAHGRYKFRYKTKNGYDTTATRTNSDVDARRVEAGLYGLTKNGSWNSKFYYYDAERGLPGFVVNGVFGHIDRLWDKNFFWQGSYKKELSRYSLLFNGKYAYDYTRFLAPDTALFYIDNRFRQQEVYLSLAQKYSITNRWHINFSADYQYNVLKANLTNFSFPERNSAFVVLASHWQYQTLKVQGSLLGSFIRETVKQNLAAPSKNVYTPALFLSWQPFSKINFQLRSFYKRIFRMPTFNDLYYTEIGNSKLNPEFVTQYNIGFLYTTIHKGKFRFSAEADAYYNEVTDKIVAMPAASQFRWTMMNLGKVKIKGVDVKTNSSYQLNILSLNLLLNYTFQQARDYSDETDFFYKQQIIYIPKNSGSVAINAGYQQWQFNYSLLYNGYRYNGKANIPENYMQPWYTSDVSVIRELQHKRQLYKITAQVNNCFNQYYDVVLSYPMPGINYKIILSVNL